MCEWRRVSVLDLSNGHNGAHGVVMALYGDGMDEVQEGFCLRPVKEAQRWWWWC